MRRETIARIDDPRIDDYRNLKDSTLAARRGRFIVEGRGTLAVLLSRSRYRPDSILLSERTFASFEAELDRLAPSCPVYVGERPVLDGIIGFPFHRGCLAACARDEMPEPLALARGALAEDPAARVVVLEGLLNLDNIGLIFRNAMALGAGAILLCPRTCDPLYRKAIRTSMGGTLCVPFARAKDLPELLVGLRELGFAILALDPGEPSVELHALDASTLGPCALVFGTEGSGLSEAAMDFADQRVRIGMEPRVDSLNVGVAAGISLAWLRNGKGRKIE